VSIAFGSQIFILESFIKTTLLAAGILDSRDSDSGQKNYDKSAYSMRCPDLAGE
jgi:hypothetical protein